MKKLLSIALCAAAVSAFGDTVTRLGGEIGVSEIRSKLTNTIVAISYDDLAGKPGETGMVYSNLVKTANLTAGDRLVEFRDNKYTGWVLAEDEVTKVKFWQEQVGAFVDSAGSTITLNSPTAATSSGMVGTGIWLVRQNPTDEKGDAKPFYIYGKPVDNPTTKIFGGTAKTPTFNLVGNPTTYDVQLTGEMLTGATSGDQIVVPGETGLLGRQSYLYNGTGWMTIHPDTGLPTSGLPKIFANQGFWYVSTGTEFTISWTNAK